MTNRRNVLFDMGNVLVTFQPWTFFPSLGITDEQEILRKRPGVVDIVRRYEGGTLSTEACFEEFRSHLGAIFSDASLRTAFMSVIGDPIEGMETLVSSVSERHEIGLVSNTNELHFNHIAESVPSVRLFRNLFLSYRMKHLKPEQEYYTMVLNRLGGVPSDCVFIDDVEMNVDQARKMGMTAVLFRSVDSLANDLDQLGVV